MNLALVISTIVLVAVIMGMSALAPASAAKPPAAPPAEGILPDVDECEVIADSNLRPAVKLRLLALAECD